MSILIKGIEKPKTCYECIFSRFYTSKEQTGNYCNLLHRVVYEYQLQIVADTPPNDCPLVEVKEPHGRLIDADKILDKMKSMMVQGEAFTTAVKYVEMIVDAAPTVIEAENGEDN